MKLAMIGSIYDLDSLGNLSWLKKPSQKAPKNLLYQRAKVHN
jgi:hypothetical protein